MATTLGAHLSPLELDSRIMSIGAEASLAKIYALEAVIDANLEADYLYAEYTVLREGGDMDDLELLYLEAEQEATKKKEGLISQLINWITTNLSRFFGWLSDLFGKKMENINPKERKKVNKYEMDRTREIITKWDKFRSGIENIINGIKENDAAKAGISVVSLLGSAGLGFLVRGKLDEDRKENDKGETTTVSGEEIIETVSKLGTIKKKLEEWIKEFNNFRSEFVDKVNAEAEKIQKNKDEKKAAKAAGANNSNTEEETKEESVITASDLFGSYFMEARNRRNKNNRNQGSKTGTGTSTDGSEPSSDQSGKSGQGQQSATGTGTASTGGTNSQTSGVNTPQNQNGSNDGKTGEGKPGTSDDGNKDGQTSGEEQKSGENKPAEGSLDDDKKEPSKVSKVQAAIKVSLQAIADLLKGLLEFVKNVFTNFKNGKNKNVNSEETDGENPEQQPEQQKQEGTEEQVEQSSAPLDYTKGDYVSESRRINLFGIDESDFDYLIEMSDDDKVDIDFLLENL